jgi:hypothetical protein
LEVFLRQCDFRYLQTMCDDGSGQSVCLSPRTFVISFGDVEKLLANVHTAEMSTLQLVPENQAFSTSATEANAGETGNRGRWNARAPGPWARSPYASTLECVVWY